MNQNVYEAPKAKLVEEEEKRPFYLVSLKKFLILYILTFSMYEIYWFYKNWALQKEFHESKIWPIPRAIFSVFFTHSLFHRINSSLEEKDESSKWNHAPLATGIVAMALVDRIFDKVVERIIGETPFMFLSMIFVFVGAWLFYQAQQKINIVCDSPEGVENSNITPANIVWIILGSLLWMLFLFATAVTIYPDLALDLNFQD